MSAYELCKALWQSLMQLEKPRETIYGFVYYLDHSNFIRQNTKPNETFTVVLSTLICLPSLPEPLKTLVGDPDKQMFSIIVTAGGSQVKDGVAQLYDISDQAAIDQLEHYRRTQLF
jgi:hypothetical protein